MTYLEPTCSLRAGLLKERTRTRERRRFRDHEEDQSWHALMSVCGVAEVRLANMRADVRSGRKARSSRTNRHQAHLHPAHHCSRFLTSIQIPSSIHTRRIERLGKEVGATPARCDVKPACADASLRLSVLTRDHLAGTFRSVSSLHFTSSVHLPTPDLAPLLSRLAICGPLVLPSTRSKLVVLSLSLADVAARAL